MNVKSFILLIAILGFQGYSQESEKFNRITSSLKPSDSIIINSNFNNGNLKESGKIYEFEFDNYIYSFYTGKRIEYYRNGTLAYEYEYNDFGIQLSCKWYDGENNLLRESKTIAIDSKAKDVKEFLVKNNHFDITVIEKIYRFDREKCDYFLKKEGQRFNGKKIGIWKTYDSNGTLQKEETF